MDRKKIPGGISFIGGLNIFAGIILMILAFNTEQGPLLFVAGFVSIIIAFGLLSLKPWARYLAIICYAANIVMCACGENFIGLAVALIIISYLFNDKVREAFSKETNEVIPTQEETNFTKINA